MVYDMHGAWDKYTHHNAPLYAHPLDLSGDNKYFNAVSGVSFAFLSELHRNFDGFSDFRFSIEFHHALLVELGGPEGKIGDGNADIRERMDLGQTRRERLLRPRFPAWHRRAVHQGTGHPRLQRGT